MGDLYDEEIYKGSFLFNRSIFLILEEIDRNIALSITQ
jgi:hypothetical protein